MINAADRAKLHHHIGAVQQHMLWHGMHHMDIHQPDTQMLVLLHLRATDDTYQHNDRVNFSPQRRERFQDCYSPKYSTAFCTDFYEDDRRGQQNDTMSYNSPSFQRCSPSPHHKRVTFEEYKDHHYRPQQHSLDLRSGSRGEDHHVHQWFTFTQIITAVIRETSTS